MLRIARKQGEYLILMNSKRQFMGAIGVAHAEGQVGMSLVFENSVQITRPELTGWADKSLEEVNRIPFGEIVP